MQIYTGFLKLVVDNIPAPCYPGHTMKKKRGPKRNRKKERAIVALVDYGKTYAEVGNIFSISRQRAHFIDKRARIEKWLRGI